MLCKKCGTKLKDGHVYCEKCGEPVQIVPDFNPLDEAVLENVAGMMNPEEKSASDWKAIQEKPVQEKTVHTHSKPQSKALTPRRKLWILGIAVTLLITGGAVGFLTYRNHSYTYQFQKAQEYRDKQKISRAIEYLERAMELKPEDPAAYETLVEIYTEQHEDCLLYTSFADKYEIHFIFDDSLPELDFYTIPRVDIMAVDSCGGYIGTIGEICDLKSDAPICYLDRNRNCYLIAENGKDFLKTVNSWKTQLKPYDEVIFYHSKEEAKKNHEFLDMSTITTVETDDSQKIPT